MKRQISICIKALVALSFIVLVAIDAMGQLKVEQVDHFEKIIVSPYIKLILNQGEMEAVSVSNTRVDENKINIVVVGKTLRIYLDKAKSYTKYYKTWENGAKYKIPYYTGTQATFKELYKLSVRGEEDVNCISAINADKFRLKLFGESNIEIASMKVGKLKASLYGENKLKIKGGSTENQIINCYGENKVDSRNFVSMSTKTNSFGESDLKLNVSKQIRVTALGESEISFVGDAQVNRGLMIGENKIYEYYAVAVTE